MRRLSTRLAITVSLLAVISAADALPQYTIEGLGFLNPDAPGGQPHGLNNLGQVVGVSINANLNAEAFVWDRVNGMRGLGILPGALDSEALGINDLGQVVGRSRADASLTEGGVAEDFMWDEAHGMRSLGFSTPGQTFADAQDINNAGQVAGTAMFADDPSNPDSNSQSFASLWTASDGHINLGFVDGNPTQPGVNAKAINEDGTIVGTANGEFTANQAFIWNSTQGMTALHTLEPDAFDTYAEDINENSDVAGASRMATGNLKAVVWSHGGPTPTALGALDAGDTDSSALALNNNGVVVGSITSPDLYLTLLDGSPLAAFGSLPLAVAWDNGSPSYLGNRLTDGGDWALLLDARDVNDLGQIIGTGIRLRPDGSLAFEGFLLTPVSDTDPVPVPASLGMFVLALAAGIRLRKQGARESLLGEA